MRTKQTNARQLRIPTASAPCDEITYALGLLAALIVTALPLATHAQPDGADTEHMFGFSEGTDIGLRGEAEAEFETIGRFGRAAGAYSAVTTNAELKYVLLDRLRISGAVAFSRYDITGLDALSNQDRFAVDRLSSELRFHALDRATQPLGLTFIATPFFGFVDPSIGAPADRYGASFIAAADTALVPDLVYAALNLGYAFERDRFHASGAFADSSTLSFNAAAAGRIKPWLYLGAEARYLRTYDGMTPDAFAGQAVYLGPVFYLPVAKGFSISGAWDIQTWGQGAGLSGGLDLINFERNQVKLRLSIDL